MTQLLKSLLLAGAALAANTALAEEWYVGGALAAGGDLAFTNPLNGKSASERGGAVFKLYGGVALADGLAWEGGYSQSGTTRFNNTLLGLPTAPTFRMNTWYTAARLSHNITEDWSVFGKAGVGYTRFKASDGAGTHDSASSARPLLGVGMAYNVTRAAAITLEYDHIGHTRKPGLDVKQDMLQLGVRVGF